MLLHGVLLDALGIEMWMLALKIEGHGLSTRKGRKLLQSGEGAAKLSSRGLSSNGKVEDEAGAQLEPAVVRFLHAEDSSGDGALAAVGWLMNEEPSASQAAHEYCHDPSGP
jgi:hypothetical protein